MQFYLKIVLILPFHCNVCSSFLQHEKRQKYFESFFYLVFFFFLFCRYRQFYLKRKKGKWEAKQNSLQVLQLHINYGSVWTKNVIYIQDFRHLLSKMKYSCNLLSTLYLSIYHTFITWLKHYSVHSHFMFLNIYRMYCFLCQSVIICKRELPDTSRVTWFRPMD